MQVRARELFEGLVGRRSGIVRQVALVDTFDGDAPLFHAGAQIANVHARLHQKHSGLGVGGAGHTRDEAIVTALCEGVERYAAACYDRDALLLATYAELGDRAIDPRTFVPFTTAQRASSHFALEPLDVDTPLRWVRGEVLGTREPVLVPAFAVYIPYVHALPEPLLGIGLTTGLACAPTLAMAEEKALYEVLERDALALTFLLGATPPRLERELPRELLPPRDRVDAFDLTTDLGVPAYFVRCIGEGPRGQLVTVGAACHPDPEQALRKACIEASQDRVYVRMLLDRDPDWAPAHDFRNLTDFEKHARTYSGRPALAMRGLGFLDGGPASAPRKQRPLPRAIGVDLTPPWAAALGLHVARVVVPELMPLHGDHTMRVLGHPRLRPESLPYHTIGHEQRIWPYPHPMP